MVLRKPLDTSKAGGAHPELVEGVGEKTEYELEYDYDYDLGTRTSIEGRGKERLTFHQATLFAMFR
jgi:hypothetical protein